MISLVSPGISNIVKDDGKESYRALKPIFDFLRSNTYTQISREKIGIFKNKQKPYGRQVVKYKLRSTDWFFCKKLVRDHYFSGVKHLYARKRLFAWMASDFHRYGKAKNRADFYTISKSEESSESAFLV